jgi:hypothetical protein
MYSLLHSLTHLYSVWLSLTRNSAFTGIQQIAPSWIHGLVLVHSGHANHSWKPYLHHWLCFRFVQVLCRAHRGRGREADRVLWSKVRAIPQAHDCWHPCNQVTRTTAARPSSCALLCSPLSQQHCSINKQHSPSNSPQQQKGRMLGFRAKMQAVVAALLLRRQNLASRP